MKFKTTNGKERFIKNARKFLVKWEEGSRSKVQLKVKKFLRPYWKRDVVLEEMPIVGTRCSIDFYNANKKIAIEVQGKQHQSYNEFFHKKDRQKWLSQLKRDALKAEFCLTNGIKLVEIYEEDELSVELFAKHGLIL